MTIATSADVTPASPPNLVINAATTPTTGVAWVAAPATALARSTWTVKFTAGGALTAGDTITVGLAAGVPVPPTPTVALTGAGYAGCGRRTPGTTPDTTVAAT